MATKKTWKWAKRRALVVYRKALKAAEGGDWQEAYRLTLRFAAAPCSFCEAYGQLHPTGGICRGICPAYRICQTREASNNAFYVVSGRRGKGVGLLHLRLTIKQLEALKV